MTKEISNSEENEPSRTYNILVYGIERKGMKAPSVAIGNKNFRLHFEPFKTTKRFYEYDGVILFKGIFERFERQNNGWETYLAHEYERNELDKREKELILLLKNKGFVCFLLCDFFVDRDGHADYESTDLAKRYLNFSHLYRENFSERVAHIDCKRDEFKKFFELYGAACTRFIIHNEGLNSRTLATVNHQAVSMVLCDDIFFTPSLIPAHERLEEYFFMLGEALSSCRNKILTEIPSWVDGFQFNEEKEISTKKIALTEEIEKIDKQSETLNKFKSILVAADDNLVDAVADVFRNGFGLPVDDTDEFKEDLKVLSADNKPIIFAEIKGTNAGIKREHINQADSHRERAGLAANFPCLLIMNTHIKNSRNVDEKDKSVADEQIRHAVNTNVLILRTLDLLYLLKAYLEGEVSQEEILSLLTTSKGWLKVNASGHEILTDAIANVA